MEAATKTLALESSDNIENGSISLLLTLNDHCILEIFQYLDLDQLCVVASTCKRMKILAEMFFRIFHRNKTMCKVRIGYDYGGELLAFSNEGYATHFLKFMQNLKICDLFVKRPLDIVELIRNECNENFRHISFEQIKFHELLGALLIDWLATVDGLQFYGCENLHEVLRYCSNLKYLRIDQDSKDKSHLWMEQRYPGLVFLKYDIMLPIQKLVKFLTNNPNVKSLALKLDSNRPTVNKQLIHQIGSTCSIEELFVTVDYQKDLELMENEFQTICNHSNFKRLHVALKRTSLWGEPFVSLSVLKKFKHLHGLHILHCDIEFPSNLTLMHLKVLQLQFVHSHISTIDLSKNLPNLEELYLSSLGTNFENIISPFARNAVKLKKIVARHFVIPDGMYMTNVHLAEYFNNERVQLVGACKMFIFADNRDIVFDESLDEPVPKFPLVEIKRVQFPANRTSFTKPFVWYYDF